MRLMLAISRARPDLADDVAARVHSAFAVIHGRAPGFHLVTNDGLDEIYTSEAEQGDLIDQHEEVFAALLLRSSYTTIGAVLDGRQLLERVRHDTHATMRSMVPPFAACYRERPGGLYAIN